MVKLVLYFLFKNVFIHSYNKYKVKIFKESHTPTHEGEDRPEQERYPCCICY